MLTRMGPIPIEHETTTGLRPGRCPRDANPSCSKGRTLLSRADLYESALCQLTLRSTVDGVCAAANAAVDAGWATAQTDAANLAQHADASCSVISLPGLPVWCCVRQHLESAHGEAKCSSA